MAVAVNMADLKPRWISGEELARMKVEKREDLVEGLLPTEGLVLFTADAKAGKSTLALELCRAVCTGTPALERFNTKRTGAIYWMADDTNVNRFVANYQKTFGGVGATDFHSLTHRQQLLDGGADELQKALYRTGAKLAVVDCLTAIRCTRETRDFVRAEYDELRVLSALATEHSCCILLLHHRATGKRGNEDNPFRLNAGSFGINAGADALLTLGLFSVTRTERVVKLVGRDTTASTFLYARDKAGRLFWIGPESWAENWDDALKVYRTTGTGPLDGSVVGEALGVSDRSGRAKLASWRIAGIVLDVGGRRHAWSEDFRAVAERLG